MNAAGTLLLLLAACAAGPPAPAPADWLPLGPYEVTSFGGEGPVRRDGDAVVLGMGSPLTGIHWPQPFPASGFAIEVTAVKRLGNDFFCALTFPVGDGAATLVLGGWGGSVVGLSCIDGHDAADNFARTTMAFAKDRPYRVRAEVTADAVRGFVDDRCILSVPRQGHAFALRAEMLPCQPVGVASYNTEASLSGLRWRRLP